MVRMGIWAELTRMCNEEYLPGQEQHQGELRHPVVLSDSRHEVILHESDCEATAPRVWQTIGWFREATRGA